MTATVTLYDPSTDSTSVLTVIDQDICFPFPPDPNDNGGSGNRRLSAAKSFAYPEDFLDDPANDDPANVYDAGLVVSDVPLRGKLQTKSGSAGLVTIVTGLRESGGSRQVRVGYIDTNVNEISPGTWYHVGSTWPPEVPVSDEK